MHVGRILDDRYEIVRPIADGAMSAVWAARDRETETDVAIKAISLERAGWRAEIRDRFVQEARLLSLSSHEHLVGLRDIRETDDGYLYLVLELLDGETLAARLARPPRFTSREAASIALAIARGLAALHAQGIVHRDVKPGNVILHRAGDRTIVKIIDLGISKVRVAAADPELFATLTATGQVLGTPQYMSYEQAIGERDLDARSDVWSLGIVLYEMLTGAPPFDGPNLNATLAAIRRDALPDVRALAPATPEPVAAILERCLERDREKRFRDAAELARELEAALVLIGESDGPVGRRRPMRGVAIGGAALGLVVVGIVTAIALRGRASTVTSAASATASAASAAPAVATAPAPSDVAPVSPVPSAIRTAASPEPSAPPAPAPRTSAQPPAQKGRPRSGHPPATRIDNAGF